jgi:hypothetical protein
MATVLIGTMIMSASAIAETYSEGQIWSIRGRRGDDGATLLIDKVEHDARLGAIYHISVAGITVHVPGGVTHELPHLPVGKQTLDASCIEVIGRSAPNPEYLDGYATWKHAFDQHQAGVFTAPVAAIIDVIESAMSNERR